MADMTDPFGFEKAIQIDHLTTAQLEQVNRIFNKDTTEDSEEE